VLTVLVAGALVSACAPPRLGEPAQGGRPADFPAQEYRSALAQGSPIYRVDAASTLIVLEVRRAGSLARLGHDHVVASHDVDGYVLPDAAHADLYVRLDRLVVDETALRDAAGFDTHPSPADIVGTRGNMLDKVLDADAYPFARIRVDGVDASGVIDVALTLHGMTRAMRVPAQIERTAGELIVSGRVTLAQTDFGIAPLSILGGAIQVRDAVDVRFRIDAKRWREPLV
jgi:hypothetical protein